MTRGRRRRPPQRTSCIARRQRPTRWHGRPPCHDRVGVQAQALRERRKRRSDAPAHAIGIEKRLSQRLPQCQQLVDSDAAHEEERHENGQHHQRAGDECAERNTAAPPYKPLMKGIARNRRARRPERDDAGVVNQFVADGHEPWTLQNAHVRVVDRRNHRVGQPAAPARCSGRRGRSPRRCRMARRAAGCRSAAPEPVWPGGCACGSRACRQLDRYRNRCCACGQRPDTRAFMSELLGPSVQARPVARDGRETSCAKSCLRPTK